MISDWQVTPEPVSFPSFVTAYSSDIQILTPGKGLVLQAPNAVMFRLGFDSDGDIISESLGLFQSPAVTFGPPVGVLPVFGQCLGDLEIFSPGGGVVFPAGAPPAQVFYLLSVDSDGALATTLVTVDYWVRLWEYNIPVATDVDGNWVFLRSFQMSNAGCGVVMPLLGTSLRGRLRVDLDGALVREDVS